MKSELMTGSPMRYPKKQKKKEHVIDKQTAYINHLLIGGSV